MPAKVLDSFALIAYFRDEAGAEMMESLLVTAGRKDNPLHMSDVTQLLDAAAAGDAQAAAAILPLVYDELRKLAAARMAAESPGNTLDATGLVHEAYLRLIGDQKFDRKWLLFNELHDCYLPASTGCEHDFRLQNPDSKPAQ